VTDVPRTGIPHRFYLWLGGALASTLGDAVMYFALAWAATIAPRVIGQVPFLDMFKEFEMKDIGVEESREMYGLILVGGWMSFVAHRAFWKKP